MLELCKKIKLKSDLCYSSSAYGNNFKNHKSFSENLRTNTPKNLYAASKICNEILAHSYSEICKFNSIGLRFFTVYGPWGRPDMAPFIFLNKILKKKTIEVFNSGKMSRDFTYVEDVSNAIIKILFKSIYTKKRIIEIFNIGRGKSIKLLKFINTYEKILNIKIKKKYLPLQKGDMISTKSNIKKLNNFINYNPNTSLLNGLTKFTAWFVNYYK